MHPYCIVTSDTSGALLVVGMVLLAEPYRFLPDHRKEAPFLWFLAAAPAEFLKQRLDNNRPRLLQALVDIGVVFSHKMRYLGRLGLHADPKGGSDLEARYLRCGLQPLPEEVRLPAIRELLRRIRPKANAAGMYFYADTEHAEDILQRSDHLRCDPQDTALPQGDS